VFKLSSGLEEGDTRDDEEKEDEEELNDEEEEGEAKEDEEWDGSESVGSGAVSWSLGRLAGGPGVRGGTMVGC